MLTWAKRISLFIITNILVLVTLNIVLSLFGIRGYVSASGIDYQALMIFCLVYGMVGAFVSLLLSRWTAKMLMGIKLIGPNSPGEYGRLYNRVSQIAQSAGLPAVPEIGIYESPEVNAFATGPSQRAALVAFSTGLLSRLSAEEIEGVAAHELSHVRNGDMVTMTLLQGIINAVVLFLAKIISFVAVQNVRDDARYGVRMAIEFVLTILLSMLGSLVVFAFSRTREYRADRGSAQLVGKEKMISALKRLLNFQELAAAGNNPASLATLKIAGSPGWSRLFMSHPALEERIRALESGTR